jgi:hypothetical protein
MLKFPVSAAIAVVFLTGCSAEFQLPTSDVEGLGRLAWCADLGRDLGTNCGFVTLEQCRAAIFGINGQCYPNPGRGVTELQAAHSG